MVPIKKEFSVMYLNNRSGGAFRNVGGGGGGGVGSSKGLLYTGFPRSLTDGYAMRKNPNKGETAAHGCHCPNLTTSWLAQLGEPRSTERVVP